METAYLYSNAVFYLFICKVHGRSSTCNMLSLLFHRVLLGSPTWRRSAILWGALSRSPACESPSNETRHQQHPRHRLPFAMEEPPLNAVNLPPISRLIIPGPWVRSTSRRIRRKGPPRESCRSTQKGSRYHTPPPPSSDPARKLPQSPRKHRELRGTLTPPFKSMLTGVRHCRHYRYSTPNTCQNTNTTPPSLNLPHSKLVPTNPSVHQRGQNKPPANDPCQRPFTA